MQQVQYLVSPCACCRYKYNVAAPSRRALCDRRKGNEYLQELGSKVVPSTIFSMQTKRVLVAQVALCRGCCCGAVEKGNPEVPVEWMKDEWKKRGLKRSIQLTISGCLGPCDLSNVITISDASGSVWLGNIRNMHQYQALVDWASQSKVAGVLLPLPDELATSQFDPFRPSGS
jgi:cobaltochelatase CobN